MWDSMWATPRGAVVGCVLTIVLLSSALFYSVDWYWFYNTKASDKGREAEIYYNSIKQIVQLKVGAGSSDSEIKKQIMAYISLMPPLLEVKKIESENLLWSISNNRILDPTRTVVSKDFSFENGPDTYSLSFKYGNRPPFTNSLFRAWSWSALDYYKSPQDYFKYKLYNRSTPLYSAFLVISLLSIPLFTRIYRDKEAFRLLKIHLVELEVKKDEAIASLVNEQQAAADKVAANDEKLVAIAKELERARADASESVEVSNEVIALMELEMEEVKYESQTLIHEREELQKTCETLESQYAATRAELVNVKSAMENLQKLSTVNFQIEHCITGEVANNMRVSKDSRVFNRLKTQVKKWVIVKGETEVNISMHGTKKIVADALAKIDKDFLKEFFVHVRNDRYGPAERRTIKVIPADNDKDFSGTVNIYLDHESGCPLSFAYRTRGKVSATNVGFVLAVLLRAACKDFDEFTIKGLG